MRTTVTVVRPGGTDKYGTPITGTTVGTVDVIIAPRTDSDRTGGEDRAPGRSAVIVGFTIYAPVGTDIRSTDQIIWNGSLFEVDGQVADWENPFTGIPRGVEAAIRRVDG